MAPRALVVPGLVIGRIHAFARFGTLGLITTPTSFATVADVALAELRLEAVPRADERTTEILSRRWG